MWYLPIVILTTILLVVFIMKQKSDWRIFVLMPVACSLILSSAIVGIDYYVQTTDTETWSGMIIDCEHKEEWNEYHPPRYEDGKLVRAGWTEHHEAENHIKTTDSGWVKVCNTPSGQKMNDRYPNTTEELSRLWLKGTPTASRHSFTNKVQASYSIYKHKNINLKHYKDLPQYPNKIRDYIYIDRIVGYVPNKEKSLDELAKWNTEMNKMIPDPKEKGKKRSWKQVNLIFVNVGENKSEDYGFALQDSWKNGGKNDYIVSFSMNKNGKINWVYPFSWSECEMLNLEVKDYIYDLKNVKDFKPVVENVSKLVIDKFERKPFAEFDYIQIEPSKACIIILWFVNIVIGIISIFILEDICF